ncbi:hypothetical protein [Aliiruegeria sabulilitoris]|uniref:hypothetical protein n=1 Tax=Aliiruegeria sabulilitoris TaxID=1510458 RepID=UPI00082F7523|nr:hypothetical protein [Aliiruegeria sabulilitoris]NDR55970.1 hypothetical protein [Pseudoruegeria sp. M32A2M]
MNRTTGRIWLRRAGSVILVFWAIAFFGSFVVFALTPSTDMGFTAGVNRVLAFLGWQAAAGTFALVGWVVRASLRPGSTLRKLLLVPVGLLGVLIAGVAALVFWASSQAPIELEPTRAPTEVPVEQGAAPE